MEKIVKKMKIKNIKKIGKNKVYDISVKDAEHYILENGVITHNTGAYYSANAIWFISRSQEKDGTDLIGFKFNIKIEKSREVREGSKIPLLVTYEHGVSKWSGLLELALKLGYVQKPKNGWYMAYDPQTEAALSGNLRAADTENKEFWDLLFDKTDFKAKIEQNYKLSGVALVEEED